MADEATAVPLSGRQSMVLGPALVSRARHALVGIELRQAVSVALSQYAWTALQHSLGMAVALTSKHGGERHGERGSHANVHVPELLLAQDARQPAMSA